MKALVAVIFLLVFQQAFASEPSSEACRLVVHVSGHDFKDSSVRSQKIRQTLIKEGLLENKDAYRIVVWPSIQFEEDQERFQNHWNSSLIRQQKDTGHLAVL